jgi:hypothetical protein
VSAYMRICVSVPVCAYTYVYVPVPVLKRLGAYIEYVYIILLG